MPLDLPGILLAGLLTFLSPCILPLVPLYLSLLAGASVAELKAGRRGTGRLILTAVAFSLGLGLVFVGLGMAATSVGHALVEHRTLLLQLGGLLIFLFGLKFLGVLKLPFLERDSRPWLTKVAPGGSALGALAFGAAFGLGWTPCIGPVLGSVLTYTATSGASPSQGALYLGMYALGLALPLVGVAAVAPWALRVLERARGQVRRFEVATGVLLLGVGLLLITDNLDRIAPDVSAPVAFVAASTGRQDASEAGANPTTHTTTSADAAASGATCTGPADGAPEGSCGVPLDVDVEVGGAASATTVPDGRVMLEFVSRTCPVCQRMAPVVAAAEHDCAGRGVSVSRVDVSEPSGAALARQFNVRGVPTFVFLDGRNEVARLVGEQSLATLEQSLEVLTGHKCDAFRKLPAAGG